MSLVAVVGSRYGVDQTKVDAFLDALQAKHPQTVVVSGGAKGTDSFAEQGWIARGGRVISYRAKDHPTGGFGIYKYELGVAQPVVFDLHLMGDPTWQEVEGALFYRNMLIADEVERAVVFWNGRSAGTRRMIDLMQGRKKPVHRMDV